jgi:DNA-binding transcriptional MerR regulator
MPRTETPTPWYTLDESAEYLRQSPHTLRAWRRDGLGPKCHKPSGGRLLYHRDDLDAWLRSSTSSNRRSTAGAA